MGAHPSESHIGQAAEKDIGHLSDLIKRHRSYLRDFKSSVLISTAHSAADNLEQFEYAPLHEPVVEIVRPSTSQPRMPCFRPLHFSKPVLSRKHASLQFLYTLAAAPGPAPVTSFLPALAPPPPTRPTSKATTPIDANSTHRQQRGKSKADLLREYRLRLGSRSVDLTWTKD